MTIKELIETLQEFPSDWAVAGTNSGSLKVGAPAWEDDRRPIAYVFTDGRPPRNTSQRQSKAHNYL